MRKKNKRQLQARVHNETPYENPPVPRGGHERRPPAPDFSYLFDQTAQEGQEFELDQQRIREDRMRRVEQVTAEFPSLKNEELFSYFEKREDGGTDAVLYEEEEPYTTDYGVEEDHMYHTIPIFNDDNNPFSVHAQTDPELDAGAGAYTEEEWEDGWDGQDEETGGSDYDETYGEAEEEEEEHNNPYLMPQDEMLPEDSDMTLYDEQDDEDDYEEPAEMSEEEAFWTGPVQMEPLPEPVEGEGFFKATAGHSAPDTTTVAASDDSFVMPEFFDEDDEEEYSSGAVVLSPGAGDDALSAHAFDGEPEEEEAYAFEAPEIDGLFAGEEDFEEEIEEEQSAEESVGEAREDMSGDGRETAEEGQPVFLRESPELVSFHSLAEDPRRRPRLDSLGGLTRYLNSDDADVSPQFYDDDDFVDGETNNAQEAEFDPSDLPSKKFFGGERSRPKTRDELNDLRAQIYHSDVGVRKYHITIANLFDSLSAERKLYVKYHPRLEGEREREREGAAPERSQSAPAGAGRSAGSRTQSPPRESIKNKMAALFQGGKKERTEPFAGEDKFGEYTSPNDVSKIRTELRGDVRASQQAATFTGIIAFFSLLVTSAEPLGIALPSFMRVSASTTGFLIVNLLLLCGAIALNLETILDSLKRLITLEFDSEAAVSVAAVFCLLQNLLLFLDVQPLAEGSVHLYSGFAILGLALHAAGKLLMHKRTQQNFKFVASSKPKKAARIIPDPEFSRQVAGEITNGEPVIAYQADTGFLSSFLKLSYAIDPAEKAAQRLAPILTVAGLVIGLLTGIIHGSFTQGVGASAASLCMAVPMAGMLCINLPLFRMSKSLLREGVLLTSSASVQEYSEVNSVMLDASELFPDGATLHGAKKFCDESVEQVMLEAAAIVCSVEGPLKGMFLKSAKDMVDLSRVQGKVEYTDRLGFSAFIDGLPAFVGTADWMRRQGIAPPERSLTEKYTSDGLELLYYAKGDKLMAFFALTHEPDGGIRRTMSQYEQTGGGFVIRSTDPFITERTVSDWFGVGNRSVRILSASLGGYYAEVMDSASRKSPAFLATTGRLSSFFRAVGACVRAKLNFTLSVMLQAAAMVLGIVLAAIFCLASGTAELNVLNLLIFLLFWIAAVLIAPNIRKT